MPQNWLSCSLRNIIFLWKFHVWKNSCTKLQEQENNRLNKQLNGRTGLASPDMPNNWLILLIEWLRYFKPSRSVWDSIFITLFHKSYYSIPKISAEGIDGSVAFQACK